MHLLVLGGTVFVGRHLVETAVGRGHDVTLFNRGQTAPDLFPDLECLNGDRDGDLTALEGRPFDAVVDTCGYLPRIVRAAASALAERAAHYTFISSISVYAESFSRLDEDAILDRIDDETVETVDGETYGPLKALCEREVVHAFAERSLIVRPGLIVGPSDPTDRFTYWPHRLNRGGEVLAPGDPDALLQFIDVRDLSEWLVAQIERRASGIFNATGPSDPLTFGDFLTRADRACGGAAELSWVSDEFLLDHQVRPWMELPLWVPATNMQTRIDRALAAGLRFRPLEQTVTDTLAWALEQPEPHDWRAGMDPTRERELLLTWRSERG